ncbi:hypothetical protein M408DRAFT_28577 [Serendipita vermifera MAFF 305830]|uniref:F-box domain-containing protein n=1 Tax=Serendipita vermifera MAFF 305830 TaxID=933852 RepID=A0A0C2W872_SERVB|nr:hypothetical protein M408DRAFT_28577 [Serendipita vermifera MAFF 305830]
MDFQWNEEFFLDTDDSNTTHNTPEIATDAASSGHIDNSLDIVGLLPPEIAWRCIFESLPSIEELSWRYASGLFSKDNRRESYSSSLFQLTSVSTKWLDLVIHCPLLWSEIHITSSNEDLLATLATFLQLSGATLLKVVIWCGDGIEWDSICNLFQGHKHRIDKLVLHTLRTNKLSRVERIEKTRHLQEFMKPFGQLSHSIELDLGGSTEIDSNLSFLLKVLPGARIVSDMGYGLLINHDATSKWVIERCTSITYHCTFQDIAPTLSSLTLAEKIAIVADPNADLEPVHTSFTSVPPRLQSVVYSGPLDPNVDRLLQLANHCLHYLTLTLSTPSITKLIETLRKLPQLRRLTLDLECSTPDELQFPIEPTDAVITSLRKLEIVTSIPQHIFLSPDLFGHNLARAEISGHLLQAFESLYRCITNLRLSPLNIRAISILESFKNLEHLFLITDGDNDGIPQENRLQRRVSLPSLIYLGTNNCEILSLLHTPKIYHLELHNPSSMASLGTCDVRELCILDIIPGNARRFDVHLSSFRNIRELRIMAKNGPIQSHYVFPSLPSFPCLRSITWYTIKRMNPEGNRLCMLLLENPYCCPSLEQLHFNDYVEWDILFLMLQRRNFEAVGIKKINTVTLTSVPHAFQNSFSDLLQGKSTRLPPDIDLSPESTREILCDPNM